MKRFCIVIFLLSMLVSGCSKKSNMLVGTKWETDDNTIMNTFFGYKYHVYEFYSEDMVSSYYLDKNGKVVESNGDFPYSLEYPTLIIEEDGKVSEFEFLDRMSFTTGGKSPYIYYRR